MIVELTPEERSNVIKGYDQIYEIMRRILLSEDEVGQEREHFWGIGFQTLDTIKYIELVALGNINRVGVSPREVFRMAVTLNCPRILVIHNHPSGSLRFSKSDIAVTTRLVEAGELLDIDVMDHLLVTTENGFRSALFPTGESPFTK